MDLVIDGAADESDPPDAKRSRTEAAPAATATPKVVLRDGVSTHVELLYPHVRSHDDVMGIKSDMASGMSCCTVYAVAAAGACCMLYDSVCLKKQTPGGFAVIANILTADEVEVFQTSFWRALTARCPSLRRDDRSTWTPENCDWKGTFGAGQYKHYGMAQEEHCWQIRRNPVIRRIFEEVLYGEECCVSIDGAAAMFGPSQSRLVLHVDLCHGLDGFDHASVQVLVPRQLPLMRLSPDVCRHGRAGLIQRLRGFRRCGPTQGWCRVCMRPRVAQAVRLDLGGTQGTGRLQAAQEALLASRGGLASAAADQARC